MVYIATRATRAPWLDSSPARLLFTGSLRPAYLLSLATAALLFLAALAGLWFGGRGLYDPDPYLLPQLYGQDAITLVLTLPLLLLSMHWTRRGSVRGLLLWTGALFYLIYSYYFYIIDVRFNPLFLVYIAGVSTSLFALLSLLTVIDPHAVRDRFRINTHERPIAGYLIGVALLFATLWIGDVIRCLVTGEPLGTVPRLVYVIDLTVVLPALALVGVWLWQRRSWGYTLAGLLLVKVGMLGVTLLINSIIAWYWHQEVRAPLTAAFGLMTLGALVCCTLLLRGIQPTGQRNSTLTYAGVRCN